MSRGFEAWGLRVRRLAPEETESGIVPDVDVKGVMLTVSVSKQLCIRNLRDENTIWLAVFGIISLYVWITEQLHGKMMMKINRYNTSLIVTQ